MRTVKVFVPLPGVTALKPTPAIVIEKQTGRTLSWLKRGDLQSEEPSHIDLNGTELKQYLASAVMEDVRNDSGEHVYEDNYAINITGTAEECDEGDENEHEKDRKTKRSEKVNTKNSAADRTDSPREPLDNTNGGSRCPSCKSTKTVKSVRFDLPQDSNDNGRAQLVSRGSSICEPFFGIPDHSRQDSGFYRMSRPGTSWSVASNNGENPNGYTATSCLRNRGSMTMCKQIPGRYFPMPTTLEEKRRTLQDTLKQSKQARIKSAPVVANHNSFPEKYFNIQSSQVAFHDRRDSYRNDVFRNRPRSSSVPRIKSRSKDDSFWDTYESHTDTFSITFRDTDTPTYDLVHLGKGDISSVGSFDKLPVTQHHTLNGDANPSRSTTPAVTTIRQSHNNGLLGLLQGRSKMLHSKK